MTKKEAKPPILMIHGAFCGPWSLDGLKEKFESAGYAVTAPCLRFHDGNPAPVALGTTGLADYAADLEEDIAALGQPPVLVGHSMGGLLAQMLASRLEIRALVLLAPSAPWGVPPTTLFEIGAAHAMHLQPGYWNHVLEPNRDVALAHSLERLPREMRDSVFGRFVPESGRATFEVMNWGLDINRASEPELTRLPGVGPALAARIVAARPFAAVDDLRRVRGVRTALFERLRPFLVTLP